MNCKTCQNEFADLLLDPTSPTSEAARAHLAECAACTREFAELQATFSLLDTWQAPDISPYFDQKLAVRLREEQAAPPAGWWERMRDRLTLNTGRQFRPALVGSLALLIIAGGGGIGITTFSSHPAQTAKVTPVSATVNDLQILDKNEQALQQMDQLLQEDAPADNNSDSPQS